MKTDYIIDLILNQLHPEKPCMINFKTIKLKVGDIKVIKQNEIIDKITHFEKLIKRPNKKRNEYILTKKGVDVINSKGYKNYKENINIQLKLKKEKENLEFEKSKIDFKLAKKMLKEFPITQLFARISLAIAILLLLKELYIVLYK